MISGMSVYEPAPDGQIFICGACGKESKTMSGIYENGAEAALGSWDESCMLNAILCYTKKGEGGLWVAVEKGGAHDPT
jgi:hypothetical protein